MNLSSPLKPKFDVEFNIGNLYHPNFHNQISDDLNLKLLIYSQYKLFMKLSDISRIIRDDVLPRHNMP